MKYIFIGLLLISANYKSFCQNDIEYLIDGKEGHHIQYYSNGKKQLEYDVVNGKVNGKIIEYYKNGSIWQKKDVINNEYTGVIIIFDKKGRIGFYQITRNDTLIEEIDSGFYFLSKKHLYGRWFWSREADKHFDKISTKNRDYFDEFWGGYGCVPVINGTTTIYYKTGQIKKVKPKTDGRRNGDWKWYNKESELKKVISYNMGKKISRKRY